MKDGEDLDNYQRDQQILNEKLVQLVVQSGLEDVLEVDPTTIATDIQNKTSARILLQREF